MEAIAKKKKSVRKREAIAARKEAAKNGPVTAKLKNVPTSPRKMRLVADLIRGERVSKALNILKYEAQNQDVKLEEADLIVKEIWVDGGRILKRLRPAPQGRAHRVRKRSNHVTMVVASLKKSGAVVSAEQETKE
jgi:large subunit ribosomal protein L22